MKFISWTGTEWTGTEWTKWTGWTLRLMDGMDGSQRQITLLNLSIPSIKNASIFVHPVYPVHPVPVHYKIFCKKQEVGVAFPAWSFFIIGIVIPGDGVYSQYYSQMLVSLFWAQKNTGTGEQVLLNADNQTDEQLMSAVNQAGCSALLALGAGYLNLLTRPLFGTRSVWKSSIRIGNWRNGIETLPQKICGQLSYNGTAAIWSAGTLAFALRESCYETVHLCPARR